jgi:hypothetical protein
MAFFNVSSFAKTGKGIRHADPYAVASALEDVGLEVVETDGNSLTFITPSGEAVKIKYNHQMKKVTVTVDGNNANELDANNLTAIQQQLNGVNFLECITFATEIYFLRLDICEFDSAGLDLLCLPEATFGFALDILRCVQFIGDPL